MLQDHQHWRPIFLQTLPGFQVEELKMRVHRNSRSSPLTEGAVINSGMTARKADEGKLNGDAIA